jgi:hypothetical protein
MLVARLLASALGLDFDNEFACWQEYVNKPAYVCEYRQDKPGLYAGVFSEDGKHITVFVDADMWSK